MAEEDIYRNKAKYNSFVSTIDSFYNHKEGQKYYCKNKNNLKYFKILFTKFEADDISYIRRLTVITVLKAVTFYIDKNLEDCNRADIDEVLICVGKRLNPKTFSDFKKTLKRIWLIILPDKDALGRSDETTVPYFVRHIKTGVDRSKQQLRKDKFSYDEFEKIIAYFSKNHCLQAYLMVAFETLARPQELLWRKIKDIELYDSYIKLYISDHSKEGTGLCGIMHSYSYLTSWLNIHPDRSNPEAFIFLNSQNKQLTPFMINKYLKKACKFLIINKPITCYSLKRNGVTFARLSGESDVEIQHRARWTSTKQLKTYDLSTQEDAFKMQLIKAGKIPADEKHKYLSPKEKKCSFCNKINKFTDVSCLTCNRPLDRNKIAVLEKERELKALDDFLNIPQIQKLFKAVSKLQKQVNKQDKTK